MLKVLITIANIAHVVALIAAGLALWLLIEAIGLMRSGSDPEAVSALYAIAMAAIPYWLAGTLHRIVEVETIRRRASDRDA